MSDQYEETFILVCEQGKSIPQDIGAWGGGSKKGVIVKVSDNFAFFAIGGCKELYVIFFPSPGLSFVDFIVWWISPPLFSVLVLFFILFFIFLKWTEGWLCF